MVMDCNYPEANLDASLYALNTSFYYSQERVVNPVEGYQLESEMPGDMVVVDHKADTYFYFHEKSGLVAYRSIDTWSPDLDSGRYFNVTNFNLTIPEPLEVANLLYVNILFDIYRPTHIYFENIDCSDAYMSLFGAVFLNANVLSDATITNIKVVNTRSLLGINAYHYLDRVEINDM